MFSVAHACLVLHIREMTFPALGSGEFFFQSSAKEWLLRGNILQLIQAEWVMFPSLFPQEIVPTARVIFTVTIFTAVALYSFYCHNFVEGMNSVRAESSHSGFKSWLCLLLAVEP